MRSFGVSCCKSCQLREAGHLLWIGLAQMNPSEGVQDYRISITPF